jgi:RNA polymerase sigma factor (sigma-70 family)
MASSDPSAHRFEALMAEHRGIVKRIAASYARDGADRADLEQEIAVELWRSFARHDPTRSFTTWMYRVALNVAISQARRAGVRARVQPLDGAESEVVDPRSEDERDGGLQLLERVLAELDPLQRALLVLYLEDRPQREIAEILGLSESNVSTRIHRMKLRLRARFPDPHNP